MDMITVQHPCLRRTMVPIYVRPAVKAADIDTTPPSEATMDLLAYAMRED